MSVSVLWAHCEIMAITATVIDDPDLGSAGHLYQNVSPVSLQGPRGVNSVTNESLFHST